MNDEIDFTLLYKQDPVFRSFCDAVIKHSIVNNNEALMNLYAAFQAGISAEALASMFSMIQKLNPPHKH